ncbi:hypothetical protein NMY22_g897 [Coprinellus aureogranulatus]|nr:hypothetical protein NMY22_g897 [Coprinellus aureogranulatus]
MSHTPEKPVVKKDGNQEEFSLMKLKRHILAVMPSGSNEESRENAAAKLADVVSTRLAYPVQSREIENVLSETASELSIDIPIYASVAITIERESIYKETTTPFSTAMQRAWTVLSPEFLDLVKRHKRCLDRMIMQDQDAHFSHAALCSFRRTYALRDQDGILERPQQFFLRTALQVHGDDIHNVRKTYDMLSTFRFMPASPILFNSGTRDAQLSSCFQLSADSDSDDIFETLCQVANISRGGGGVGLGLQALPCQGSRVDGIVRRGLPPVLKLLDAAVDAVDQGMNKRPTAIAAYIEPWHADVLPFVRMKRITGADAGHTERLFHALWVNDLFMDRVHQDKEWSLFCPSEAPQLIDLCGVDFEEEYERLEMGGFQRATIRARDLWKEIILSQIESGGPFILFKDSVNEKSNERHLGTITHGNLCTEVVQRSSECQTAVCNLASVVLPTFVKNDGSFDFASLEAVVRHIVLFLNCVLRRTQAPNHTARIAITENRAIGIGVQGLADTFAKMCYPFDSKEAFKLNAEIAETIYYAAVDESCDLTRHFGAYPTFKDSPAYFGWLQFDHWDNPILSDRYNWTRLHHKIQKGMANSLLIAYMPTAGTTQLTGCSECFEPYHSMIHVRKVQGGQYTAIPTPLVEKLQELDLWDEEIVNEILSHDGSLQSIEKIPALVRAIFKTAWEIDPSVLIKMAVARAPFTCQSQSMSLFFKQPTLTEVSKALFLSWRSGLKTGIYYLRTKPASKPLPVALPVELWGRTDENLPSEECIACSAKGTISTDPPGLIYTHRRLPYYIGRRPFSIICGEDKLTFCALRTPPQQLFTASLDDGRQCQGKDLRRREIQPTSTTSRQRFKTKGDSTYFDNVKAKIQRQKEIRPTSTTSRQRSKTKGNSTYIDNVKAKIHDNTIDLLHLSHERYSWNIDLHCKRPKRQEGKAQELTLYELANFSVRIANRKRSFRTPSSTSGYNSQVEETQEVKGYLPGLHHTRTTASDRCSLPPHRGAPRSTAKLWPGTPAESIQAQSLYSFTSTIQRYAPAHLSSGHHVGAMDVPQAAVAPLPALIRAPVLRVTSNGSQLIAFAILFSIALVYLIAHNRYQIQNTLSYATRPLWDKDTGPKDFVTHYYAEGVKMDEHLCKLHSWKKREDTVRVKVLDAVLMSSELDLLEIRLNELDGVVDHFLIVESNATFTGLPKETFFANNLDRYAKFADKIETMSKFPAGTQSLVFMSDSDEIPAEYTIRLLKACDFGKDIHLQLRNFMYSFEWYLGYSSWRASAHIWGWDSYYRHSKSTELFLSDAGWHCSYCFRTIPEYIIKMKGFSHADRISGRINLLDPKRIQDTICRGRDIFGMLPEAYSYIYFFSRLNLDPLKTDQYAEPVPVGPQSQD